MPRDNFQHLFAIKPNSGDANPSSSSSSAALHDTNQNVTLADDGQAPGHTSDAQSSSTTHDETTEHDNDKTTHNAAETPTLITPTKTKPGTESLSYLKRRFLSPALQNIRELKLSEKMNALADNLEDYPDRVGEKVKQRMEERKNAWAASVSCEEVDVNDNHATTLDLNRKQSDEAMEEECRQLKIQSVEACKEISQGYDALVKFVHENPHGSYEEFIECLLLDATSNESNHDTECSHNDNTFMNEDFYGNNSHYRRLWNDNLTLGLNNDSTTTTLDGRAFVRAINNGDEDDLHVPFPSDGTQPQTTIDTTTTQKLASSAFNVLSNVSSLAMKPLRDLQLAEKVNAMQLDVEEEETRREIERYYAREEEKRDLEEMMRLKKEAEERTLTLTRDHLVHFIEENPNATYQEWIEDLHPENAHDGALLEGFGKTIDHRFFVEESDHRQIWNESLTKENYSTKYVPPRPKQMDDNGQLVVAADLLSGSGHDTEKYIAGEANANLVNCSSNSDGTPRSRQNTDLISFD